MYGDIGFTKDGVELIYYEDDAQAFANEWFNKSRELSVEFVERVDKMLEDEEID